MLSPNPGVFLNLVYENAYGTYAMLLNSHYGSTQSDS